MSDYVYVPPVPGNSSDNDDVVVDGTVGGVLLLNANPKRRTALIVNIGEAEMRVTTDGTPPSATRGKIVPPGAQLELTSPYCPAGEVRAIRMGDVDTCANASEVT